MNVIDLEAARQSRTGSDIPAELIETTITTLSEAPYSPEVAQQAAELLIHRLKQNEVQDDGPDPEEIKARLRAWLETRDYHYVHASEHFWLHDAATAKWIPISRSAIANDNPLLASRKIMHLFLEVLREQDRWHDTATYSFTLQPPGVLNQLRYNFLTPKTGVHHWIFDALVESICGGKEENIQHLERLILAKLQNPADYTLPALCFSDDGGTGKSLFVSVVLSAIFGKRLVSDNLAIAQATGKFNSVLVGKAVVFINEAVEDKADNDALKRIIGSQIITVEPKGVDPYTADNTPLYILAGNGIAGCVRLSGTRVDRRYSVITGTAPLEHYLAQQRNTTTDAALNWLHNEGIALLSDPEQVACWLGHLTAKHGTVGRVPALHGEDYRRLLGIQTPLHEQVFELIFLDSDFSHIKLSTLRDVYQDLHRRHNGGTGHIRGRKLYEHARKWLQSKRPEIEQRKVKWGGRTTTADVFADPVVCGTGPLRVNDDDYIEIDDNGRIRSRIDLT